MTENNLSGEQFTRARSPYPPQRQDAATHQAAWRRRPHPVATLPFPLAQVGGVAQRPPRAVMPVQPSPAYAAVSAYHPVPGPGTAVAVALPATAGRASFRHQSSPPAGPWARDALMAASQPDARMLETGPLRAARAIGPGGDAAGTRSPHDGSCGCCPPQNQPEGRHTHPDSCRYLISHPLQGKSTHSCYRAIPPLPVSGMPAIARCRVSIPSPAVGPSSPYG